MPDSHLSIGGVRMSFANCDSALLPPPFATFATDERGSRFTVTRERTSYPAQPALANNDVWQLYEAGDHLCLTAGVTGAARPLLRADLASDWSGGDIRVDPDAPLATQQAPVTSHLGELIVLAQLNLQAGLYVHAASERHLG